MYVVTAVVWYAVRNLGDGHQDFSAGSVGARRGELQFILPDDQASELCSRQVTVHR